MLSRLAENLFWMGRYVERAENIARLLDVNYHATLEAPKWFPVRWEPLLRITTSQESFQEHFPEVTPYNVPVWLAIHPSNNSSIRGCITAARENARSLRDRIPSEMWEVINREYFKLGFANQELINEDGLHSYCITARDASHLFFGIAEATLPRDEGWLFLQAGRMLERADSVLRMLAEYYQDIPTAAQNQVEIQNHHWMAVLKSVSAYEGYRKQYQSRLEPARIAAFLMQSQTFPRSVIYNLQTLKNILEELADLTQHSSREISRKLGWLIAQLDYGVPMDSLLSGNTQMLRDMADALWKISDDMGRLYFLARYA
ncbi:alpha-E domain-containing protein [Deinococcus roseus]|uniref:DUF403 domain-containing protein n=1 Tax=Deinococcus roseus TaxID=392414 RepID=A0ABQ2CYY6_9DEIO|nr:alpha-E domain-containing protein [Deinococcus roseus]GGJ31026.1 hypothetical protein GCM10008938_16400 [Deinococcus roseus]